MSTTPPCSQLRAGSRRASPRPGRRASRGCRRSSRSARGRGRRRAPASTAPARPTASATARGRDAVRRRGSRAPRPCRPRSPCAVAAGVAQMRRGSAARRRGRRPARRRRAAGGRATRPAITKKVARAPAARQRVEHARRPDGVGTVVEGQLHRAHRGGLLPIRATSKHRRHEADAQVIARAIMFGMAAGTRAEQFSLGREVSDGEFVRQQSRFRGRVGPGEAFPAEPGRYHLYVAMACPWSQRAVIVRRLKRLEDVISISYLHPYRDERGWAFTGGPFTDEVNGFAFLKQAYDATVDDYEGRVTVPVLWDKETSQVVSNESGELTRMLGSAFDAWGDAVRRPLPARAARRDRRAERGRLQPVNNGVYRTGFATSAGGLRAGLHGALRHARRARGPARQPPLPDRRARSPRPTGASSPRSCASTPSTTRTSAATAGASSSTRTCGATRASSTSSRASPRRWPWTRSSATTTRRTTCSTRSASSRRRPLGRRLRAPHGRG